MERTESVTPLEELQEKLKLVKKLHAVINSVCTILSMLEFTVPMNTSIAISAVGGCNFGDSLLTSTFRETPPQLAMVFLLCLVAQMVLTAINCLLWAFNLRLNKAVIVEVGFASWNITIGLLYLLGLKMKLNFVSACNQRDKPYVNTIAWVSSSLLFIHGVIRFLVLCFFLTRTLLSSNVTKKPPCKTRSVLYDSILPACNMKKYTFSKV